MNVKLKTVVSAALLSTKSASTSLAADTDDQTGAENTSAATTPAAGVDAGVIDTTVENIATTEICSFRGCDRCNALGPEGVEDSDASEVLTEEPWMVEIETATQAPSSNEPCAIKIVMVCNAKGTDVDASTTQAPSESECTPEATTDKQWIVDAEKPASQKGTLAILPDLGTCHVDGEDSILAVSPLKTGIVSLTVTVREIPAQDKDHVLLLLYSSQTSPSPQILTPNSQNKLALDLSATKIIAIYNIPAQKMLLQSPTRLGVVNPAPRSAITFRVNLDTGVLLPTLIENDEQVHFQAALMPKADFDSERYDFTILSELDSLKFVEQECPDNRVVK